MVAHWWKKYAGLDSPPLVWSWVELLMLTFFALCDACPSSQFWLSLFSFSWQRLLHFSLPFPFDPTSPWSILWVNWAQITRQGVSVRVLLAATWESYNIQRSHERRPQKIYKDYAKDIIPVLFSLPRRPVQITPLFSSLRMPDCPYFFFWAKTIHALN